MIVAICMGITVFAVIVYGNIKDEDVEYYL